MRIEISKDMINNLVFFLDRVQLKGLKEVKAMSDIMNSLYSADEDNKEE